MVLNSSVRERDRNLKEAEALKGDRDLHLRRILLHRNRRDHLFSEFGEVG